MTAVGTFDIGVCSSHFINTRRFSELANLPSGACVTWF